MVGSAADGPERWGNRVDGEDAMKCFVYLRVSGKAQVRGDGFRRQFIACREYAAAHGLQIVGIFKERGVSGTKELDDRPALSRLFAALEENGVKTLLIEKLDRLARDLMVSETIVKDIKTSGYTLLSTCEPDLCSNDPSRNFMRVIFTAIAQLEKELLVIKLRGARQRMRIREGRCEGRRPYGSHPDYPGEKAVVARMIVLREEGNRPDQIAQILNSEGVETRGTKHGKSPWHPSTINKILARNKEKRLSCA